MKGFSNFFQMKTVRAKILLGFSLIIAVLFVSSIYTFFSTDKMNKATENMVQQEMELLIAYTNLSASVAERISASRAFVLSGDTIYIDHFNHYTEVGKQNEAIIRSFEDSQQFDMLINQTIAWRQYVTTNVFEVYAQGNIRQAQLNLIGVNEEVEKFRSGYEDLAIESAEIIKQLGAVTITQGSRTAIVNIGITIIILLLAVIIAFITAHLISKPLKLVTNRMFLIASGNVSEAPLRVTSQDEIGQLIQSTNEMNAQMNSLLLEIHTVSSTVASHSEELSQSAHEVQIGTEQTALTMQELASGAETQANGATELSVLINSFSETVQNTNTNGESVQRHSEEVLHLTNEGTKCMNDSMNQMHTIYEIVSDSVEKVKGLDEQSDQITKLVTVINDIAEQTNLLALNAAIEAARAGEHGKGFAVVADEVRKLAEQVAHSVTDISQIVVSMQQETSNVTVALTKGYAEVEEGTKQIAQTSTTFTQIKEAIIQMDHDIQVVAKNLSSLKEGTGTISNTIEEIAAVSEEAAAGIEQTSASVQQVASSMVEVTSSSDQLSKLSDQLNGLVQQFQVAESK